MRPEQIPLIRNLDLFRDMAEDSFRDLVRAAYVQTFPPQVDLITEGDPADFLHIVLSGSVELFASWNGRETSMATMRPISTFILAATIKDAPYLMSARTAEKSQIIMLPSLDVRTVFEADNGFARAVVTELAQGYRSVVKTAKDLKLRTSMERLANYLLRCQRGADGALAAENPTTLWALTVNGVVVNCPSYQVQAHDVVAVREETVEVDFNHELAGRTLRFEVEVVDRQPGHEG